MQTVESQKNANQSQLNVLIYPDASLASATAVVMSMPGIGV